MDPQSLSDEQLQAILDRQQVAGSDEREPMAQAVAPDGNAPTAEVALIEPSRAASVWLWDVMRTASAEAADAERAGQLEEGLRYAEQHEALKQHQRELRKRARRTESRDCATDQRNDYRVVASREVLRQNGLRTAPTKRATA